MNMYRHLCNLLAVEVAQGQFDLHIPKLTEEEQAVYKAWSPKDKDANEDLIAAILVKLQTFKRTIRIGCDPFTPDTIFGRDIKNYGLDQIKHCYEMGLSLCLPNTTSDQWQMLNAAFSAVAQVYGWKDGRTWLKEPVTYRPYIEGKGIMTYADVNYANIRKLSAESLEISEDAICRTMIATNHMIKPIPDSIPPILAFQLALYGCFSEVEFNLYKLNGKSVAELWDWVNAQRGLPHI